MYYSYRGYRALSDYIFPEVTLITLWNLLAETDTQKVKRLIYLLQGDTFEEFNKYLASILVMSTLNHFKLNHQTAHPTTCESSPTLPNLTSRPQINQHWASLLIQHDDIGGMNIVVRPPKTVDVRNS